VDFLLRKRVAAPRSVPAITTIMAAIFQWPVGHLGATDQSGPFKGGGTTGAAGTKGAAGVGTAASWFHGLFRPRETSDKGSTGRDLFGKVGLGGGTIGGTFGALLLDVSATGIGRGEETGFCDCGDTGADASVVDFVGDGVGGTMIAGTGASVFSAGGVDCSPGDTMCGTCASDGVDDGLFAEGTAGCAFSDIANGEI
jgi:hypothetical protein